MLLLASITHSYAGNKDSLLSALHNYNKNDTFKVKLYKSIANEYRAGSPDSIGIYADSGIALAQRINYQRGIAECLVAKTLWCLIFNHTDSGRIYCNKAISIYNSLNDSLAMGPAFYYMGAICYNASRFEESIAYYKLTVRVYTQTKDFDRVGDALDNIGITYSSIGNFIESLKYYLEGLAVREKANDTAGIATSYGNIGRVYAALGNRKRAIQYVHRSLEMQKNAHDPTTLMINYEDAGNVYLTLNELDSAKAAFSKALEVVNSAGLLGEENRIMVNLAEVYITAGDYTRADSLYKICMANTRTPNMQATDAMLHRGIGRVAMYKKDYATGIRELEFALKMFEEDDMRDHLAETLKNLSDAYSSMGNYKKAWEDLKKYEAYRDKISDDETKKKIQNLQYEYELQKKQSQIELLSKDKELASTQAEKQRAIEIGLAGGMVLLGILAVITYRYSRKQASSRHKIEEQAASLQELNTYKDKIFSVLSHDLRGPIGALSTSLTLLDENLISPKEFSDLKPLVHKQMVSVTQLLDNLLKWSMTHITGGKDLPRERINIRQIVAQNFGVVQTMAEEKMIKLENNIPADTFATANGGQVDVIIRNLLSNAVKFTGSGGLISVAATTRSGKTLISIRDSGVGMSQSKIDKLFTPATDNTTIGTKGERGVGLGLLLSIEFARANGGDITVESHPGSGSTFTLELPQSDI